MGRENIEEKLSQCFNIKSKPEFQIKLCVSTPEIFFICMFFQEQQIREQNVCRVRQIPETRPGNRDDNGVTEPSASFGCVTVYTPSHTFILTPGLVQVSLLYTSQSARDSAVLGTVCY